MNQFTDQQENYFSMLLDTNADILLEARAGCGKTTCLVEGAKRYRNARKSESILSVAFNKSIATELAERMPSGVECSTLHSLGFKILKAARPDLRFRVDGRKSMNLLKDITSGIEFEDMIKITNAVASLKQRLNKVEDVDEAMAGAILEEEGNEAKWATHVVRVFETSFDHITSRGEIDFDDMLWGPFALGLRPLYKYSLVQVDEAQDLNPMQEWMVLRHIESLKGRLVICGDPKQAIYGFAGASERGMQAIADKRKHRSKPKEVVKCTISQTFRCATDIVEFAKTQCMPEDQLSNFISFREDSGEVQIVSTEDAQFIEVDDFREGEAILCRTNKPLMEAAIWFLANDHGFKLNGKEFIKQLKSRMCRGLSNKQDKQAAKRQVQAWLEDRIEYAISVNRPNLADRHRDVAECCFVFIDLPSLKTIKDIKDKLDELEYDRPGPVLSSIHKAKGLEWEKVWWIGRDRQLTQMKRRGDDEDPLSQEWNLQYVAATRAKDHLVVVDQLPVSAENMS